MLSDFQKEKITYYFNVVLDQDKNGLFEENDFTEIGEAMCILWRFKPFSEEYNGVMDRMRNNWHMFEKHFSLECGVADVHNFLIFVDKMLSPGKEELYHSFVTQMVGDVFDSFDVNKDGVISINEYVNMFMCYHIKIKSSAKAFRKIDDNGDDHIVKEEFLEAMDQFFKSNDPKAAGNWLFGFWGEEEED